MNPHPVPALPRPLLAGILLVAGLGLAGAGGWIHVKAWLAQYLLASAWARTVQDGGTHRPWPWADTYPVARLRAPEHGIEQFVLAGDSGRVLAFGPGWAPASAAPGGSGRTIISGHRDTQFRWLKGLQPGDHLELAGRSGTRTYVVASSHIADARRERLALDEGAAELSLVTCWPFDALAPGGPWRYVITARPLAEARDPMSGTTETRH